MIISGVKIWAAQISFYLFLLVDGFADCLFFFSDQIIRCFCEPNAFD